MITFKNLILFAIALISVPFARAMGPLPHISVIIDPHARRSMQEVLTHRLTIVAQEGNENEARELIAAGAEVNPKNVWVFPLDEAAHYGHVALCKLFLANGAHMRDKEQLQHILINGAKNNRPQLCELFVQVNNGIEAALKCLYRMKKNGHECAKLLYIQRESLFLRYLPDFANFTPTARTLKAKDGNGNRAFDYLQIDCLNPDLLSKRKKK